MNRLMIALSLAAVMAFTPFTDAKSSGSGSGSSGGDFQGKIQSVATTVFSVGLRRGRHRVKPMVVHYNPDTTTVTVDGVVVRTFDYRAIGKYVHITGTIQNTQIEATSITVTSSPPSHSKRSKSKSKNT